MRSVSILLIALAYPFISTAHAGLEVKTLNGLLQSNPFYMEFGHRNTTYVVANIAGLDETTAHRLAYFSQTPDEKAFLYSAPAVAIWGIVWPPYRHRIVSTLHSLHGGSPDAVYERRQKLRDLIAACDKKDTAVQWKIGFLIHAYGDSYAHVKPFRGSEKAYGQLVGHGFDNTIMPDYIGCHVDNYINYVRNLYIALGGNPHNTTRLNDFISKIEEASKITDYKARETGINFTIMRYPVGDAKALSIPKPEWDNEVQNVNSFLKKLTKVLKENSATNVQWN